MIQLFNLTIIRSRDLPVSSLLWNEVSRDRSTLYMYRYSKMFFIQSSWYSSDSSDSVDQDNKDKIVNTFFLNFLSELYNRLDGSTLPLRYEVQKGFMLKCGVSKYQDKVLSILEDSKKQFPLSEKDLTDLQYRIESLTILFDEHKNRYQISPEKIYIDSTSATVKRHRIGSAVGGVI